MQTGLECIGSLDMAAMGEVLALAAESLSLLGRDYLLDLGHMGLVSALLEAVSDEMLRKSLLAELGRKPPAGQADPDIPRSRWRSLPYPCGAADYRTGHPPVRHWPAQADIPGK